MERLSQEQMGAISEAGKVRSWSVEDPPHAEDENIEDRTPQHPPAIDRGLHK